VPKNKETDLIGYQDFTFQQRVVNSLQENGIPKNGISFLTLKLKRLLFKLQRTGNYSDSGVFA